MAAELLGMRQTPKSIAVLCEANEHVEVAETLERGSRDVKFLSPAETTDSGFGPLVRSAIPAQISSHHDPQCQDFVIFHFGVSLSRSYALGRDLEGSPLASSITRD